MESPRPNIVLIMTDQHRADCLSLAGHPDVMTPNLDHLAHDGAWFRQAYTPAPICSPARHALLTGREPATNGVLDNSPVRIRDPHLALPNLLRNAGYQTASIGRTMHQHPGHARYGFEIIEKSPFNSHDSRAHWTIRQTSRSGPFSNWPHLMDHGMSMDGYRARPWPYDEMFHQTTWSANKAIEFIDRRDMDAPYFLYLGFTAPHPPLVPPACYYERYAQRELAPPVVGDWVELPENNAVGMGVCARHIPLGGQLLHTTMAGYYGLINHVDDMLYNVLHRINMEREPTYVVFCSDHGEMLGDHGRFRKAVPYQAAVQIPFLIHGPRIKPKTVVDKPVTLCDILPTVCDLADISKPAGIDGKSLLPLLHGESDRHHAYVHGEGAGVPGGGHGGYHFLTDGQSKFIWWSQDGREQLFDLRLDPRETHDLIRDPAHAPQRSMWRQRLAEKLRGRPEGFVESNTLIPGRSHQSTLPHAVPV